MSQANLLYLLIGKKTAEGKNLESKHNSLLPGLVYYLSGVPKKCSSVPKNSPQKFLNLICCIRFFLEKFDFFSSDSGRFFQDTRYDVRTDGRMDSHRNAKRHQKMALQPGLEEAKLILNWYLCGSLQRKDEFWLTKIIKLGNKIPRKREFYQREWGNEKTEMCTCPSANDTVIHRKQ